MNGLPILCMVCVTSNLTVPSGLFVLSSPKARFGLHFRLVCLWEKCPVAIIMTTHSLHPVVYPWQMFHCNVVSPPLGELIGYLV